jgi:hypothetical protein
MHFVYQAQPKFLSKAEQVPDLLKKNDILVLPWSQTIPFIP